MATWTVTDNILPQVLDQIRTLSVRTLEGAGMAFQEKAVQECPVSDIDEPGYIHLYQTIGYDVSAATTYFQQWVTFFALKHYAIYVNNGTSRMAPRPFFTLGLLEVERRFDDIARAIFRDLMLGRPPAKL